MSLVIYIVLSVLMELYLIYLAYESKTDGTVPKKPGYIVMGMCALLYLIGCVLTWRIPNWKQLAIAVAFVLVMLLFGVYRMGIAKALLAIVFISAYSWKPDNQIFHEVDLPVLSIVFVVTVAVNAAVYVWKNIKQGTRLMDIFYGKGKKIPMYSHLAIGYGVSMLFCIARNTL